MKQATLHISFDAGDIELLHRINQISASKCINKSGFVRQLLRNSLASYEQQDINRTQTILSL
jgi:metal-responsive CopG/Arc/MetJ family transcriptional regulator